MTRALGVLVFLPVPVVLWLFTTAPLGVLGSLALGIAIMVTHRLYARPFALRHAPERCLWCGGAARSGPRLEVRDPLGAAPWRACGAEHAERLARLLGWAEAHRRPLKAGILGTLLPFLPLSLLADRGVLGGVTHLDVVSLFRLGIAISVLTLSLRFGSAAPVALDRLRSPFPLHLQALIGSNAVLWLFRGVGVVWLALAVRHALHRAGDS
jgi:hypothetical protein